VACQGPDGATQSRPVGRSWEDSGGKDAKGRDVVGDGWRPTAPGRQRLARPCEGTKEAGDNCKTFHPRFESGRRLLDTNDLRALHLGGPHAFGRFPKRCMQPANYQSCARVHRAVLFVTRGDSFLLPRTADQCWCRAISSSAVAELAFLVVPPTIEAATVGHGAAVQVARADRRKQ